MQKDNQLDLKRFGDLCRAGRTTSTLSVDEIQVVRRLCQRVKTGTAIPREIQIWKLGLSLQMEPAKEMCHQVA